MSSPTTVAILGSCVTRDIFNRQFNPGYKEHFECVALSNQASIISLAAPPATLDPASLSGVDDKAQAEILYEASRSFFHDVARLTPDLLIVDFFADAHFGCVRLSDSRGQDVVMTANRWKLMRTDLFRAAETHPLPSKPPSYLRRWRKAAATVVSQLAELSPSTRLVLHAARNTTTIRRDDGTIAPLRAAAQHKRQNRAWDAMNTHFADHFPVEVINVWQADTSTFRDHPWGPFPVHYELDYHARFLHALIDITRDQPQRQKSLEDSSSESVVPRL